MDDSRIFALVESGNISLMLGSFRKVRHYSWPPFLPLLFVVLLYFHVCYSNLLHFLDQIFIRQKLSKIYAYSYILILALSLLDYLTIDRSDD